MFQPHIVPSDVEPLMVLVNVKSGGCQGLELIRSFRKLLNPFQVFDILNGGPLVGCEIYHVFESKCFKALVQPFRLSQHSQVPDPGLWW